MALALREAQRHAAYIRDSDLMISLDVAQGVYGQMAEVVILCVLRIGLARVVDA